MVSSIFSFHAKKGIPCDDPGSDREREVDMNGVLGVGSRVIRRPSALVSRNSRVLILVVRCKPDFGIEICTSDTVPEIEIC